MLVESLTANGWEHTHLRLLIQWAKTFIGYNTSKYVYPTNVVNRVNRVQGAHLKPCYLPLTRKHIITNILTINMPLFPVLLFYLRVANNIMVSGNLQMLPTLKENELALTASGPEVTSKIPVCTECQMVECCQCKEEWYHTTCIRIPKTALKHCVISRRQHGTTTNYHHHSIMTNVG